MKTRKQQLIMGWIEIAGKIADHTKNQIEEAGRFFGEDKRTFLVYRNAIADLMDAIIRSGKIEETYDLAIGQLRQMKEFDKKNIEEFMGREDKSDYLDPELVEKLIRSSNGKMFTVTFDKQDGSVRTMNARTGVYKYSNGGTRTTEGRPELIGVYDNGKADYRVVNKNRVRQLKIGGKVYSA